MHIAQVPGVAIPWSHDCSRHELTPSYIAFVDVFEPRFPRFVVPAPVPNKKARRFARAFLIWLGD